MKRSLKMNISYSNNMNLAVNKYFYTVNQESWYKNSVTLFLDRKSFVRYYYYSLEIFVKKKAMKYLSITYVYTSGYSIIPSYNLPQVFSSFSFTPFLSVIIVHNTNNYPREKLFRFLFR